MLASDVVGVARRSEAIVRAWAAGLGGWPRCRACSLRRTRSSPDPSACRLAGGPAA